MKTDWYKDVNPNLDKLTELLGMAGPKPSHGYTVAEKAPEVVTAPGIYFPAERGNVIPLESRQEGGSVSPSLHKDDDRAKLEMLNSIISLIKLSHMELRPSSGSVIPQQGELEKLNIEQSKYDILKSAISVLKPQGQQKSPSGEKKPTEGGTIPLKPRQEGGSVDPNDQTITLPKPPSSMINLPTSGSYGIKPDAMKSDVIDMEKNVEDTWSVPMFSRATGGRVWPSTPESLELEKRKLWEIPGYAEQALAEARKTNPNAVAISPGYERGYYEAHPEERFMEAATEANKPVMDMYQKLIEENKNRSQGYGLIGLSPREAGIARVQAAKNVPELTQGMERLMATNVAEPEKYFKDMTREPKTTAPHLVQDASGQYVWATPGGILPAGLMGRTTSPGAVSNEELVRGDLRTRLKREPTAGEVLDEIDKRKLNMQGGGIPPLSPGSISAPTTRGVKNENALEGLTEEQKGMVRGLTSYKYPWPGSFAMKDPKWQAIMGRAEMYDPTFSAPEYQVRFKLRQDFTSGKSAQNIRSLNTAVAHLDTLSTKADALFNAPIQLWNAIKNKGLTAVGDKRVTQFNSAATAVESELANVFKGMGASDQEIKAWRQNLSTSQSPEQLKGAINTAIELLSGRLGALQAQYEIGLGQPKDFTFLSPKSRTILKGLGANVDAFDSAVGGQETVPSGVVPRLPNESVAEYLNRTGGK